MLIEELRHIKIDENTRLCSFDITNTYTNIPKDEIPHIIQYAIENSHTTYDTFITEIQNFIHVIVEQNYFQLNNLFFINKQMA
jgi:hypothetical protein